MVHLLKLAVGITDLAHLRAVQAVRARHPPLRHQTRNTPRRTAELIDGGSIYWVIAGTLLARQRVLAVVQDRWDDHTPCAGLVLDPALVQVEGRPVKAFQGWRYLEADDAPPDLDDAAFAPGAMPPQMGNALRALGLL